MPCWSSMACTPMMQSWLQVKSVTLVSASSEASVALVRKVSMAR